MVTHTERRLDHMLADWIGEQFHAAPAGLTDAEILAAIQARLASKAEAIFRKRYPPIMGPV
jgi:hypothetical protein